MKFQVRLSGFLHGLLPAVTTATTGIAREYSDGEKISITANGNDLFVDANNGNVALRNSLTAVADIDFKPASDGCVTVKAVDLKSLLEAYCSDEDVTFETVNNELIITPESDPDQKSSMPFDTKLVVMPDPAVAYEKEVEISRETLTNAMRKVVFAVGDEKYKPAYLYWVLRIRKDGFRVAAGDGSRFSVYEIAGANVVKTQEEFNIHVSKEHDAVLQKLLESGKDDNVTIREFGSNPALAQIVFTFDTITMTLIGHDPGIKWPDENKFVNRKNNVKYISAMSDWEPVLKGVQATYNEDARQAAKPHYCLLTFDPVKNAINVKAEHTLKTTRKVRIQDSLIADGGDGNVTFNCVSKYMGEMYKLSSPGDRIQMEFSDPSKPVVVHFYAGEKVADAPLYKDDATKQTREMFLLFIAPVAKLNGTDAK